ncbi:uncharacterized protein DUF4270 [Mariniflexile fucanivorans]|uniref:Uncharacterized protein DUF4270 n=1 Tax=Mariniflexile fucanivorans TaxID=264023 RepID=A0A4R1RSC6_9FLAO|nr:DUF4270 domain-containing protein [Mariniflexile fucanivorans]TCL68930.1 uncharacterized protein DUF4270 [Mariniflexile fucanivorans]
MKKTIKALKYLTVLLLVFLSFIACDKDFSVVESDVLGEQNLNFKTDTLGFQIAAYNKKLESLQINGLSSNLLGVYNDPAYGQTMASIITQITPTTLSPNFNDTPAIDSVVLSIPYFSRVTGTDTDGNPTYTILDSLYGSKTEEDIKPFRLTIYQNNYFLRDFDPSASLNETQKYYSKADGSINSTDNFALNGSSIINFDSNKGAIIKDTVFAPSSNSIRLDTFDDDGELETTVYIAPAFRTKLDPTFWKAAILDKEGDAVLSSANDFKNYFRGLYFKAEAVNGDGSMVLLNLASTNNANITIYYSINDADADADGIPNYADIDFTGTVDTDIDGINDTWDIDATTTATDSDGDGIRDDIPSPGSYVLNFTGNILNTFINDYSQVTFPTNPNTEIGDEKLYLKGTEGSMAVVDLFNGMVDYTDSDGFTSSIPALEKFKKEYRIPLENGEYKKDANGNYILKRFINDAQLIVFEDDNLLTGGDTDLHQYDRIYAYDIENNTQLVDYNYDSTAGNTVTPYFSTYFHLGLRDTDDANVSKYKIHLTEHLNNILLRDSTNTKIGLVLSSNVNKVNSSKILNSTGEVTTVPSVSILTPRGTILYGTNPSVPANRKMKLKVFFTEPK